MRKKFVVAIGAVVLAGSLAACGDRPAGSVAKAVKIDGSSTVFPVTEAVAEEFQKQRRGAIRVTVGISGTGGGFKKFCRGEIDISNASRPILKKEMEACAAAGIRYYELPVAYDALTVIVNPRNDFIQQLSVEQLKKIWAPEAQATITSWKQVDPAWPDVPLKLYGPGADSGTFDYFTEAVVGKSKSSRGDFTASEDDNVLVQGVSSDKGGLGYFGFAYYLENQDKLKAVPIVARAGAKAVAPSAQSVENGSYQPLSRPIFIYISEQSYRRPEVREFVDFYLTQGQQLIREVKYIPLPAEAYAASPRHLAGGKVGTVFGGRPDVGLTIMELLKREARL